MRSVRRTSPVRPVAGAKRRGMNVSVKAALILLLPALAIRFALVFGANVPGFLLFILLAVLYVIAGIMGAKFYTQNNSPKRVGRKVNFPQQSGVIAGLVLCILSWVIVIVVSLISDLVSSSLVVQLGASVMAISAFTEVIGSMLLAALGVRIGISGYR